jgi:hypothetical protein
MKENKLESSVNQQEKLKQKGVTQMVFKEGLRVFRNLLENYTNTEILVSDSPKFSEQDQPFFWFSGETSPLCFNSNINIQKHTIQNIQSNTTFN